MLLPHVEGDAALIRHCHGNKINGHLYISPTHVILAGNGAVAGGTRPLLRTLDDATSRVVDERAAASVCAVLAQTYKDLKHFALKDLIEVIDNVGSLDKYLAEYYAFKASLSDHYVRAYDSGELALRSSDALDAAIASVSPSNIGVITTNWDACFWHSERFKNVVQLHGLAGEPESIVLPGEFTSDEELAEILDNHGFVIEDDNVRTQVQRMFRGDFRRPLTAALHTADSWLSRAQTIVVWGLALHPYDAEVCRLLWHFRTSNNHPIRVVAINPSETDRSMCRFLFSPQHFAFSEFSA